MIIWQNSQAVLPYDYYKENREPGNGCGSLFSVPCSLSSVLIPLFTVHCSLFTKFMTHFFCLTST